MIHKSIICLSEIEPKLNVASVFESTCSEALFEKVVVLDGCIGDEEVRILQCGGSVIRAEIREYHVIVDLEKREILHDCPDWARCVPDRSFCKHLGKIFLLIPRASAEDILRRIFVERDIWRFKPYLES